MSNSNAKTEQAKPVPIDAADRLRAASSPTRMRLFKILSWRGPSRTSDLADELGLPHNTVSYHLKGLEKAGYIRRDEGEDRRESWWSLASDAGVSLDMSPEFQDLAHDLVRLDHQVIAEMIARSESINADGKWPTLSAGFGVALDEDELREVFHRLGNLVEDIYRRRSHLDREAPASPVYYLAVNFFPVRLPDH